jgi:tungstate transport system substrate-binding protein
MGMVISMAAALLFGLAACSSAAAQTPALKVGVTTAATAALVGFLAPAFHAATAARVEPEFLPADLSGSEQASALLLPEKVASQSRWSGVPQNPVFSTDIVLVGFRTERARVRGGRDIRAAFRAIANTRGTFVSSSSQLGIRSLEIGFWADVGIDVGTRLTWYETSTGDDASALRQARALGAYVLVERGTFLDLTDPRGLEVLISGDPVLKMTYRSVLTDAASEPARLWHEWLASAPANSLIRDFRYGAIPLFEPTSAGAEPGTPARHPS